MSDLAEKAVYDMTQQLRSSVDILENYFRLKPPPILTPENFQSNVSTNNFSADPTDISTKG